jgi:RHS repeat-associated protein
MKNVAVSDEDNELAAIWAGYRRATTLKNPIGTVSTVQSLDYLPFGATRVNTIVGGANSARQYIGQFADNSGLSYLSARYYDPSRGQFTTEEPIFIAMGDRNQVKELAQQELQRYLTDPQKLNAYGYGRDNPITQKDPTGKVPVAAGAAPFLIPEEVGVTFIQPEIGIPLLIGTAVAGGAIGYDLSQSGPHGLTWPTKSWIAPSPPLMAGPTGPQKACLMTLS